MPRSAEEERSDRLAARARKKKGTGGKNRAVQGQWLGGASLTQIASQNNFKAQRRETEEARALQIEHEQREFIRKTNESVKSTVAQCLEELPKKGSFSVSKTTQGFQEIVRILMNEFRDSEFRWHFGTTAFLLARKR
jgi:hypothetical protein